MTWTRLDRFLMTCFVLSALFVALEDRVNAGCDNKCRERQYFYDCKGGGCVDYQYPDCVLCTTNVCDSSLLALAGTCLVNNMLNQAQRPNANCLTFCDCANFAWVETTQGNTPGNWMALSKVFQCQQNVPPP